MKKLFTAALFLMAMTSMTAQENQKIIESLGGGLMATLPEYSYNGKIQMYSYSIDHPFENGATHFVFYDDNFGVQRTWEVPHMTSLKTYEQSLTPEVTGYELKVDYETTDTSYSLRGYSFSFSYYDDNDERVEVHVPYGGWTIDLATSLIKYYKWSSILKQETTSEGTFFYISYSHDDDGRDIEDYPVEWYWLKNDGTLVYVHRYYKKEPIYGTNYVVGEKRLQGTYSTSGILPVERYNYDMESGVSNSHLPMYLSQTLFNDDQKYEYLAPIITDGLTEIYESYTSYEGISIKCFVKRYGGAVTGFKVMSEDGSAISSVNFGGNFVYSFELASYTRLVTINGKTCLVFKGYVLDEANLTRKDAMLIYTLDKETNQIRKVVEQVSDVSVYPQVADRSEQITVELGADAEKSVREIQVVNAAGKVVARMPVSAGQRSISFPASQLSNGLNIVNVVGRKGHQATKVMVK